MTRIDRIRYALARWHVLPALTLFCAVVNALATHGPWALLRAVWFGALGVCLWRTDNRLVEAYHRLAQSIATLREELPDPEDLGALLSRHKEWEQACQALEADIAEDHRGQAHRDRALLLGLLCATAALRPATDALTPLLDAIREQNSPSDKSLG